MAAATKSVDLESIARSAARDAEAVPDQGFPLAEDDLRWYFAESAAALGFHGAGTEPGGGGVFDDAASHRAHMQRREHRFRVAAARLRRIDALVKMLPSWAHEDARLAYTPHAWPTAVRVVFTLRRGVCVAALAAKTQRAIDLRDRRKPKEGVAEFLAFEASQCAQSKRVPQRLRVIRDDAAALLANVLRMYEAKRIEDVQRSARERELYIDGVTR